MFVNTTPWNITCTQPQYNSGYNHNFVVEQQPQNMDLSISIIYEKVMLTKNKGHDNLNT